MLLYTDPDQRCLKTRSSEDGCTFPPNIFAPNPKSPPKPHFGGPFNANPIIHGAFRKSHVNVATNAETLQLYRYRQVLGGKGYVKIFPLEGVRGA